MPDAAAPTDRLVSLADTVYVAERCSTLYTQVFKAACTSMLWALLELEGFDPSVLDRSMRGDIPTEDLLVHDRSVYPVPVITEVDAATRRLALTDDSWLRVAVVRDPYSRVYSAWESKILLGDPGPWQQLGAPDFIMTNKGLDVGASFRAFVADLCHRPETWHVEPHFATQASLVRPEEIDYTDIVATSEVSSLLDRLEQRAEQTCSRRRANEGLGLGYDELYDDETAAMVAESYAVDFELGGFQTRPFGEGGTVILDHVALSLRDAAIARSRRTVDLAASFAERDAERSAAAAEAPARKRHRVWRS